jgi:BirA family transcriptional regulator, biotin operon repressor / biotin---[acetyl-CoA-carboxylase] ligase
MGREWISPVGNLYASGIVRLQAGDPPASSLAFVTAISVHQALCDIEGNSGWQIKWPNDVLSSSGAKISGMLLERSGDAVIIGIGVNLSHSPTGLDRRVTSLQEEGIDPPSAHDFLHILAGIFETKLQLWRCLGLAPVLSEWQARAHPMGTKLQVNLPSGEAILGEYDGLSSDGALMLRLADGSIRAIHAADVFLIE